MPYHNTVADWLYLSFCGQTIKGSDILWSGGRCEGRHFGERDGEREKERERERERDRETERQRDRDRDTETQRQKYRETEQALHVQLLRTTDVLSYMHCHIGQCAGAIRNFQRMDVHQIQLYCFIALCF